MSSGGVFALLGRNGAGKTTTLKLLSGLLRPTAGESKVLGRPSLALSAADWQRIGYVSEGQELYAWMTIDESLAFTRPLYPDWDLQLERSLRRTLGLDFDRKVEHCSRGERAKLALLLALPFRPRLLLLDEPLSGLDPLSREELLSALLAITEQEQWSVFFSTQEVDEVERFADRVGILEAGRLRLDEALPDLQARFRTVQLRMPAEPSAPVVWGDVLDLQQEGASVRFVHPRFSPQVEAELRARFAQATLDVRTMSLREIFVALARAYREGSDHD